MNTKRQVPERVRKLRPMPRASSATSRHTTCFQFSENVCKNRSACRLGAPERIEHERFAPHLGRKDMALDDPLLRQLLQVFVYRMPAGATPGPFCNRPCKSAHRYGILYGAENVDNLLSKEPAQARPATFHVPSPLAVRPTSSAAKWKMILLTWTTRWSCG